MRSKPSSCTIPTETAGSRGRGDRCAPSKKEALYTVVHDFEPGWDTVSEKPGYRFLLVDYAFKDVRPEQYDGLLLPGGRAPST